MRLSANNLSKSYHQHTVLDVPAATFGDYGIEGLIGPNGAGKSTLLGLLTRRLSATTGSVSFEIDGHDHDLMGLRSFQVARLGLIKSNQRIQGFDSLSIRDSLRMAATPPERETWKSVWQQDRGDPEIEDEIDALLDEFPFADPAGSAMSGGERKLLDILRCLIVKPRMLLMDEPTAGLPAEITDRVMAFIRTKVEAKEMIVLIIEHDLDLIWSHCDYVHFLSEGKLLFQGNPEEVKKNRVVAEKYLGV